MADLNVLPLFTDAYLADTTHLSTEEHGAYDLLLIAMWRAGGRLQADQVFLQRVTKSTPKRWPRLWSAVRKFFIEKGGFITQKRLRKEYVIASQRKETARANGNKGGRPSKPPNHLKTHDQTKATGSVRVSNSKTETEPTEKLSTSSSSRVLDSSASVNSQSERAKPSEREPALAEIVACRAAIAKEFEAIGRISPDTSIAEVWARQGLDLALCVAVVHEGLQRKRDVSNLRYFEKQIREAHEKRLNGHAAPAAEPTESKLRELHGYWLRNKTWPFDRDIFGSEPGTPGTKITEEMIAEWSGP